MTKLVERVLYLQYALQARLSNVVFMIQTEKLQNTCYTTGLSTSTANTMFKASTENTGEFQEKDHGCYYTYKPTDNEWALSLGFTHEVDVIDGIRFAIVKKTVVKMLIDEYKVESWQIKNHIIYNRK